MDKREFNKIRRRGKGRNKTIQNLVRIGVLVAIVVLSILLIVGAASLVKKLFQGKKDKEQEALNQITIEQQRYEKAIADAEYLSATYDFDAL